MRQLLLVHSKAELLYSRVLVTGLLWSFFLLGCDVFRTRTPEEPEVVASSYIPATEPSIVFQNIQNAFAEKNVVNYLKSLSDSTFTFVPSSQAQSIYASLFQAWNKQSEEQYFMSLCNKTSPKIDWISLQEQARTTSTVQFEVTYKITGLLQNEVAEGRSQFLMRLSTSQLWVIDKWFDYEMNTQKSYTWSTVKALYAQ